ncbi:MAG: hypothetical protein AAF357_14380, partial [Verrucomicrobiota bacterium]
DARLRAFPISGFIGTAFIVLGRAKTTNKSQSPQKATFIHDPRNEFFGTERRHDPFETEKNREILSATAVID